MEAHVLAWPSLAETESCGNSMSLMVRQLIVQEAQSLSRHSLVTPRARRAIEEVSRMLPSSKHSDQQRPSPCQTSRG